MILRIGKATKDLKAVTGEQRFHSQPGVLVTVFGVDRFTLSKIDIKTQIGDPHALIAQTDQVHLIRLRS